MFCPYDKFRERNCEECGAKMLVENPICKTNYIVCCAIAHNGGAPSYPSDPNEKTIERKDEDAYKQKYDPLVSRY